MSQNPSRLSIDTVDPKSLSRDDVSSLNEVMQDVWADGIGEFVQCVECHHVHSKKDIYGSLPEERYKMTVRQIMWDFEIDTLRCIECNGRVKFIFWNHHIEVIRDRLQRTRKAFLVIARDTTGSIVWFEDAYIDKLPAMFDRELHYHYHDIGVAEIERRAIQALWHDPKEYLVLSDIGIRSSYQSFQNVFRILQKMAGIMTPEYDIHPCCSELDENNSLYRVSMALGWISLGIGRDPRLASKIKNTWRGYKSDLIVSHAITRTYRESFSESPRTLLSLMRSEK
jgi:hypothetical protein